MLQLAMDSLDVGRLQPQQVGELANDPLRLLELLGDKVDMVVAAVDRDPLSVPVDDQATSRRYQHELEAIALGKELVAPTFGD